MVNAYVPEGLARRYFINKADNVKDDDCYCGPGNINVSEDFHSSPRLKYLNQFPAGLLRIAPLFINVLKDQAVFEIAEIRCPCAASPVLLDSN